MLLCKHLTATMFVLFTHLNQTTNNSNACLITYTCVTLELSTIKQPVNVLNPQQMYKSLRLFVFVLVLVSVSVCSFKVKPLASSAYNTVYGWWVVARGGGRK